MRKYNKFETIYRNSKQYALGKEAGSKIEDQKEYNKETVYFERIVYMTFKQNVFMTFGFDVDRTTFVFEQNELKTYENGRKSLKYLCRVFYIENEAEFLEKLNAQ